jgi:hypothetical protein
MDDFNGGNWFALRRNGKQSRPGAHYHVDVVVTMCRGMVVDSVAVLTHRADAHRDVRPTAVGMCRTESEQRTLEQSHKRMRQR